MIIGLITYFVVYCVVTECTKCYPLDRLDLYCAISLLENYSRFSTTNQGI